MMVKLKLLTLTRNIVFTEEDKVFSESLSANRYIDYNQKVIEASEAEMQSLGVKHGKLVVSQHSAQGYNTAAGNKSHDPDEVLKELGGRWQEKIKPHFSDIDFVDGTYSLNFLFSRLGKKRALEIRTKDIKNIQHPDFKKKLDDACFTIPHRETVVGELYRYIIESTDEYCKTFPEQAD